MIPEAAVEAAYREVVELSSRPGSWTLEDTLRAALEAAAPHMFAHWFSGALEEWAVQFSSGGLEEADDKAEAIRKLADIREAIQDGMESPKLEPMAIIHRWRVQETELTPWKVSP